MAIERMTVPEAAAVLRCSQAQIRRLIRRGKLAASRNGKAFLIAPEAITAYLNDTRVFGNVNA